MGIGLWGSVPISETVNLGYDIYIANGLTILSYRDGAQEVSHDAGAEEEHEGESHVDGLEVAEHSSEAEDNNNKLAGLRFEFSSEESMGVRGK